MDFENVILKPLLTEKSNLLREMKERQYAFRVDSRVNKVQVRRAIENLFQVKTLACKIVNVSGKKKSVGMRGGRRTSGLRSSWKKAYVTLAENNKIDYFEGV